MKVLSKNNLFKNSGKKIKKCAQILFFLELIAGIIVSIILTADDVNGVWLLLIPAFAIVAFIFNLVLYGFGEIVDSTSTTAKASKETNQIIDIDELPKL